MKNLPILLLPVLALLSLFWGSADIAATDVWRALTTGGADGSAASFIVLHVRLPQMLTALLAGSALAAAGLVMQTVFANPLADPSLLGVNAGAGLGAAVAMLFLGGSLAAGSLSLSGYVLTVVAACVGAFGVIALLVLFSALFRGNLQLLVAGVMVSFAASSVIAILSYFATAQGLQGYVLWGMGDFSAVTTERLPAFAAAILLCLAFLWLQTKPLNALLLGNDYAANLGIRVRPTRTGLLLATGLLSAVVTALCGPVAFIGLAAPHIARFLHHTADHRRLLPLTFAWGADIALLAVLLTHLPGGIVLPINAITPLLGVPVVFVLLFKRSV